MNTGNICDSKNDRIVLVELFISVFGMLMDVNKETYKNWLDIIKLTRPLLLLDSPKAGSEITFSEKKPGGLKKIWGDWFRFWDPLK